MSSQLIVKIIIIMLKPRVSFLSAFNFLFIFIFFIIFLCDHLNHFFVSPRKSLIDSF